jgi:hypothetical protein
VADVVVAVVPESAVVLVPSFFAVLSSPTNVSPAPGLTATTVQVQSAFAVESVAATDVSPPAAIL